MHIEIDTGTAYGIALSHMMDSSILPIPVLQNYIVLLLNISLIFQKSTPYFKVGNTEHHTTLLIVNIWIKHMSKQP